MAEGTFKNIIIGSILIVLFAFLILSIMISLGNEYGADVSGVENNSIDLSDINGTLSDVQSEAEDWREIFEEESIWSVVAGIVTTGIFNVGVKMFSFVVDMIDLIFIQILNNTLGVPVIVTGVIFAVIIILAILGIWRLLKQGD